MQKIIYVSSLIFLSGVCFVSFVSGAAEEFPVSPPPLTEGIYPCSNCHATMGVNRKKRELKEEHSQIKLHHAETMRWCLDCHDGRNRDKLRLYNGELINFNESYRLCGNVTGLIQGRRVFMEKNGILYGSGKRTYYLCAHCHEPG
jgi:hypothetical protein